MTPRRYIPALLLCVAASAQALYDPKPADGLAALQGEWRGTLTYADYSQPGKRETLPTTLFVALASPAELVLHYVYDDGPGKTVYSYEQMAFDFEAGRVSWASGSPRKPAVVSILKTVTDADGQRRWVFERDGEKQRERWTLETGGGRLALEKVEIDSTGTPQFRNRYEFRRAVP